MWIVKVWHVGRGMDDWSQCRTPEEVAFVVADALCADETSLNKEVAAQVVISRLTPANETDLINEKHEMVRPSRHKM
jgi:hypothetical protein